MTTSTHELLQKHFDTAFAAPDGIAKLRELILTFAMQGKLVEQDPKDIPASELVKEIESEVQQLAKQGKSKKPKMLPEINIQEMPHQIPENWIWVRFGAIAQHNSGKTLDKGRNTGKPRDYITTSNLYWGRFELDNVRQMLIRDDELEKCTAKQNDLLICEGGEAGRAAVWCFDSEVCFQNHVHRARLYKNINPYFAYRFFEKLNATGEINQHRKGVGISNMSSKALASIAFPLPPLPEQRRIVAKVDQLMSQCDELEKLKKERDAKRLATHAAAIQQLTSTGEDSAKGGNFIQRHFHDLYTVKENVDELRKAILQLAVMGKLVPQDSNDPPAGELLKQIESEKTRLIKEKKIKKPKPLPRIKADEVPYELPQGWEWVRIGELGNLQTGNTPPSRDPLNYGDYIPFIGPGDIQNGKLDITGGGLSKVGLSKGRLIEANSIMMVCIGGSIGKHVLNKVDVTCNQQINTITPFSPLSSDYLYQSMASSYFQQNVLKNAGGSATPIINKQKWSMIAIPLPPLPEQRRIVSKVDQLMALCDELEQRIDASTAKRSSLLNAVMSQVA